MGCFAELLVVLNNISLYTKNKSPAFIANHLEMNIIHE